MFDSPIEIFRFLFWISFLIAIFVAVIESKKDSNILKYAGGGIFIWLFSPHTESGERTNSEIIIWWARLSFILGVVSNIMYAVKN